MKVAYIGPALHNTGYGHAASNYCLAMLRAGIDLVIIPPVDITEVELEQADERYAPLLECFGDVGYPDVVISHALPFACSSFLEDVPIPRHALRVANTVYETETLSQSSIADLEEHFDLVMVPSNYNLVSFRRQMRAPEKCVLIPHTFDPAHWKAARAPRKTSEYVFYTIGTWCERKNPMGLLKSYLTEFGPEDDVLLRIKTPSYGEKQIAELVGMLKIPHLPPVEILCEPLDEEALMDFHTSGDCFVTTTHSEGFGLGAFEARLLGNPVIAPGYSGLLDFLYPSDTVKLVPHFLTPAVTPETEHNKVMRVHGLEIKPVLRADHMGIGGDQNWCEPDLHTTKKYMRQAYEDNWSPDDIDRDRLERTFSYDAVGQLILKTFADALAKRA